MNRRRWIEIGVTVILFTLMIAFPPGKVGAFGITGNVILDSQEDVQTAVQEMVRHDFFKQIKDGSKICLHVQVSEELDYNFKIRKSSGFISVTPSQTWCDGQANEDLIFSFLSFRDLLDYQNTINLDYFKQGDLTSKFHVWPSKYVENGGLLTCEADFTEKYCGIANEYFTTGEMKEYGMSCCIDPELQAAKGLLGTLRGLFFQYWWILAIIALIATLGVGSYLLLSNKDEETQVEKNTDIYKYIKKSRRKGFADFIIRRSLKGAGWENQDIGYEFDRIRKEDISTLTDRFTKVI